MLIFRKALVRIRREYNQEPKRLYLLSGGLVIIFAGIGLVIDALLPFSGLGNIVRSLILIPTSVAVFVFGYAVGLFFHYARMNQKSGWVPYRLRMSPSWRRRISAIVAAFLAVLVYASGFKIGYTLVSSIFVSIVIALFAFMRTTKEESAREEFNIPDVRDVRYNAHMQKLSEQRETVEKERLKKKQSKRNKLLGKDEEDE